MRLSCSVRNMPAVAQLENRSGARRGLARAPPLAKPRGAYPGRTRSLMPKRDHGLSDCRTSVRSRAEPLDQ